MFINVLIILQALSFHLANFNQNNCGSLIINSAGFNNDLGKSVVYIYRINDKIPGSPYRIETDLIKEKKAQIVVRDLPFDDYAIILLHDENNNGKIDHSLGIPNEQLGYSNNWTLGLFSGMPTFSRLKFKFSSNTSTQNINITFKN